MHLSICIQLCFLIYWTSTAFCQQGCNVTNKFGEGCHYTCHCRDDTACSQDGSCSEGCQYGWFGPACQYKDIQPTGNMELSWNENSKQNIYALFWDVLFKFTWMRLQFKETVRAGTNSINSISFFKEGDFQFCEKSVVTVMDDYTYNVHCDTVMFIDSLNIYIDSQWLLQTINISGGLDDELRLLAWNTSTIRSSRFYKAFEGSTNGYNCTSSLVNTTNADVNNKDILLNHYMLSSLDGPCQLFRLVKYSNSEVYSFSDSGHLAFMYMINYGTIPLIPYKEIHYSVSTAGVILELCEVHLVQECTEIPRYTIHCNRQSNCLNQTDGCLFSTGQCASGCPVGFTDECCTHSNWSLCFHQRHLCQ